MSLDPQLPHQGRFRQKRSQGLLPMSLLIFPLLLPTPSLLQHRSATARLLK
jgi:hypothetical protein